MPAHPLVLHSSILRLALSMSTPVIVLGLGVFGLTVRVWAVTIGLTLIGFALLLVVMLDLPFRAEFDADGITRVCMLRRHHLPWSEVVALERLRARPPAPWSSESRRGREDRTPRRSQGLVARVGARRVVMLVDRRESRREFEALRNLVADRATTMRAGEPPIDALPAGRGPTSLHAR